MATTPGKAATSFQGLGFRTLGENIHLYTPPAGQATTTEQTPNSPGLIIVCGWAFSKEKHLAIYLRWYRQIYPAAHILLLQSDTANLLWRPSAWQASVYEPAVLAVKEYLSGSSSSSSSSSSDPPRVLIHLFSNGGAYTAVQLAEFYAAAAAAASTETYPELRIGALILDSSPGRPSAQQTVKALSVGLAPPSSGALTRSVWQSLAYAFVGTVGLLDATGVTQSPIPKLWQVLKDPGSPFLQPSTRRAYIFSDADDLVNAGDVKLHAQLSTEALERTHGVTAQQAAARVRCAELQGTAHVNHMLRDPERYWGIVKDTWVASLSV